MQSDPTCSYKSEIDHFLKQALSLGCINQAEYKYLTKDFPIKPVIYGLPKVHKTFDGFPKCRPIIASIGSLTEPLSNFVDHHIRPLVEKLPSYLKDTGDFINQFSDVTLNSSELILATMDVVSPYTNIPHSFGLVALRRTTFSMEKAFTSRHMEQQWGQVLPLTMQTYLWVGLNLNMCTVIILS